MEKFNRRLLMSERRSDERILTQVRTDAEWQAQHPTDDASKRMLRQDLV